MMESETKQAIAVICLFLASICLVIYGACKIDHLRIRIDTETIPPDIVRNCFAVPDHMVATFDHIHDTWKHNLILTWDGETGEIKSVEILK
jgi:hypothetical protein